MDCECLLGTAYNSQSLKSDWNHYSSFPDPHWFLCGTCFSSLPLLKIQLCKDRWYHWKECSMILILKLNDLELVTCTPSDTCWEYCYVFPRNRKCLMEPLWVHCRFPGWLIAQFGNHALSMGWPKSAVPLLLVLCLFSGVILASGLLSWGPRAFEVAERKSGQGCWACQPWNGGHLNTSFWDAGEAYSSPEFQTLVGQGEETRRQREWWSRPLFMVKDTCQWPLPFKTVNSGNKREEEGMGRLFLISPLH